MAYRQPACLEQYVRQPGAGDGTEADLHSGRGLPSPGAGAWVPLGQDAETGGVNTRSAAADVERVALPSFEELRAISAREGVDAATALLYRSVLASPQHGWFIERI